MNEKCPKCGAARVRAKLTGRFLKFGCGTFVAPDDRPTSILPGTYESKQCLRNQLKTARHLVADLVAGNPDCEVDVLREAMEFTK